MNPLHEALYNALRKSGDQTATQLRRAIAEQGLDVAIGNVGAALEGMIFEGRVRRVKQYYRAVGLPIVKYDPSMLTLEFDGVRMVSQKSRGQCG